jgi:hypothetical protein
MATYLIDTPSRRSEPKFERIECELARGGNTGSRQYRAERDEGLLRIPEGIQLQRTPGAPFTSLTSTRSKPSITNAKAFANEEGADRWFAYPRWSKDEKVIVYHASPSLVHLHGYSDGSTVQSVNRKIGADYRYPHMRSDTEVGLWKRNGQHIPTVGGACWIRTIDTGDGGCTFEAGVIRMHEENQSRSIGATS